MGCDIYFYKHTEKIETDKDGSTNLLYVTQRYEGIEPHLVGNEYYDFEKYFRTEDFQILENGYSHILAKVNGKKIRVDLSNDKNIPTFTRMEEAIPVKEIGYYRISYGQGAKRIGESFSLFTKQDKEFTNIIKSCIGNKLDVTPEFFKTKILNELKLNKFKTIAKKLEKILNKLPETEIIHVSY